MRSFGSTPFKELVELLYGEKKPGEVLTRKFIVEILQSLLQIFPESPASLSEQRPTPRPTSISISEPAVAQLKHKSSRPDFRATPSASQVDSTSTIPEGYPCVALYLAALLKQEPEKKSLDDVFSQPAHDRPGSRILCPATELPAPKLDVHDFLKRAHKERVYKTYLRELNDVCRDFFWQVSLCLFPHDGRLYRLIISVRCVQTG